MDRQTESMTTLLDMKPAYGARSAEATQTADFNPVMVRILWLHNHPRATAPGTVPARRLC
jgi:hypothetical protein